MVKQGVSVRPRLPLCVCEGVLLFMMLPAINHVFPRRGMTVERGKNHGRCTDDTPARRKGSRRGSCRVFSGFFLFLFRFSSFSSSIRLTFMPANTPSTKVYIWFLPGPLLCAQWLAEAPGLELLRRPINGRFVKFRVPGTPRPPWKLIKGRTCREKNSSVWPGIKSTNGAVLTIWRRFAKLASRPEDRRFLEASYASLKVNNSKKIEKHLIRIVMAFFPHRRCDSTFIVNQPVNGSDSLSLSSSSCIFPPNMFSLNVCWNGAERHHSCQHSASLSLLRPSLKIGPVLEMCLWKMSSKPSSPCIHIHMGQISLVSVMWLYLYFGRFLLTVENGAQWAVVPF